MGMPGFDASYGELRRRTVCCHNGGPGKNKPHVKDWVGEGSGWSDLNSALEKSDIMEHYGSATMPVQMRMFVESVHGRGSGCQDGSAMLQLQVMSESGSMHSSALDMSGSMR